MPQASVPGHTIAEPAAVIAGYGLAPEMGQVYLIIRWDETDFSVSFVLSEEASDHGPDGGLRVIGTACDDTGYKAVDAWIAHDVLAQEPHELHQVPEKHRGYTREYPEGDSGSCYRTGFGGQRTRP